MNRRFEDLPIELRIRKTRGLHNTDAVITVVWPGVGNMEKRITTHWLAYIIGHGWQKVPRVWEQ